jgi:ribosomal protein L34E
MKLDLNFDREALKKSCPKCGESFQCVIKEACWCENIYVSKENLSKIRRLYLDCLCEKCLKEFSVGEN